MFPAHTLEPVFNACGHETDAVFRNFVESNIRLRVLNRLPIFFDAGYASACGREKICCMNSRGKFDFCVLRVTSRPAASEIKNAGTWLMQEKAELTLEVMGHQGLGWEGDAFKPDELAAVRQWLGGKATTIYGGSQEVQSNIVSKRILGLPDLTQNH